MCDKEQKNKRYVYLFLLMVMFVVSLIFLKSFYWPYKVVSRRKIFVYAIALFMVGAVPIICVKVQIIYNFLLGNIKKLLEKLRHNKKKSIVVGSVLLLCVFIAYFLTKVICFYAYQGEYNTHMFYLLLSLFVMFVVSIFMWRTVTSKPERLFFFVALIAGVFCIAVTPAKTGVSWDDQIHYYRTLEWSNLLNGIMYKADEKNINEYVYVNSGYDRETESQYISDMQKIYEDKEYSVYGGFFDSDTVFEVYRVAYLPAALGVMLARGFGMSYVGVFNMGRAFNLLMYITLVYFAIKRIKFGKILVSVVGLLPPIIFMASSYSYDPWVTGFTLLGLAYFFAELQDDEVLKNKNLIIMIGAMVLGCFPKAVYFPMLFPLLFMPKRKFSSRKQRRYYYVAIISGGLLLVASFVLPIILNGAGTGDIRGGADVNSTQQIEFILNRPMQYAKVLLHFLSQYISVKSVGPMLQFFAYVGQGKYWGIVILILVVVACLDREGRKSTHAIVKVSTLVGCTAALVLATTALYIDFTSVASNTVAGMSGRYMIPFVFPVLYALGNEGTTHQINKNLFASVPMLLVALTFMINISTFCVIHY